MNKTLATVVSNDPIWDSIRQAAAAMAADGPQPVDRAALAAPCRLPPLVITR